MLRLYLNGLGWVGWFAQGVLGRILSNSPCRDHRGRGRGCSNWAENGFLHLSFSFRPNLNVWNVIFLCHIHIMHIYANLCTFMHIYAGLHPEVQLLLLPPSGPPCRQSQLSRGRCSGLFLNFNPLIPGFNLKTWNQSFIQFNLHLISIKPLIHGAPGSENSGQLLWSRKALPVPKVGRELFIRGEIIWLGQQCYNWTLCQVHGWSGRFRGSGFLALFEKPPLEMPRTMWTPGLPCSWYF